MSKLVIDRLETRKRYTKPVDMRFVTDTRVSPQGRLIGVYLQSLPENGNIDYEDLEKFLGSGRDATRAAVKSLKDAGYLSIEKDKGQDGQFYCTWTIREYSPASDCPSTDKPHTGNPYVDNKPKTKTGTEEQPSNSKVVSMFAPHTENPYVDKKDENTSVEAAQGKTPHTGQPHVDNPANHNKLTRSNKNQTNKAPDKPVRGKKTSSSKNPASEPKHSADARELVNYLSDCLKKHGAKPGQFDARWFFAGCSIAEQLLGIESLQDLKAATSWLVEHQYFGPSINSMQSIKNRLTSWQRMKQEGPQAGPGRGGSSLYERGRVDVKGAK